MPIAIIFGLVIVIGLLYVSSANASCANTDNSCANPVNASYGFNINNPGNLRWIENPQARWQGMVANVNGYARFDTLSNGVRAIGKQLTRDYNGGANTLNKIIPIWAPSSDNNNTQAYVADVSQRINVAPDDPLEPFQDLLPDLTAAIIIHENGHNTIDEGDLLTYLNS